MLLKHRKDVEKLSFAELFGLAIHGMLMDIIGNIMYRHLTVHRLGVVMAVFVQIPWV